MEVKDFQILDKTNLHIVICKNVVIKLSYTERVKCISYLMLTCITNSYLLNCYINPIYLIVLILHTSTSFHKKLASPLATIFSVRVPYQNVKHWTHDLIHHVYEHLDMTSLINRTAWSPNRTDLCLEMFLHVMILQDLSFSGAS